jgi:CRISPR-associated protein Cas5d
VLELKVWSDFACFTRPENKVERVSYEVMTPSAARGVLEAVFWKPQFSWQIREIWVLNPIRRFSILRNEINSLAVASTAKKWASSGGGYFAEEDRAQRHALVLRDVCYLIRAEIVLKPGASDSAIKFREMFLRRAEKGQAHHQPYLGNREFSAFFSLPDGNETPLELTDDLGRMLFDLEFNPSKEGKMQYRQHQMTGDTVTSSVVKGVAVPRFFNARLERGVLHVPPELYEVR